MSRFRIQARFSAALEAKIYDFFVLLGVSKNELRYMKPEKKISLLFLSMALLMTAACTKNHTPAEVKTPVGFRAMSQVVVSKADDGTSNKLPASVAKFGVWGIAGNDLNIQYLWNSSTLTDVNRQSDGTTYVPSYDGYWFSNSTHDFLALASDPSTVALPNVAITTTGNPNHLNPVMTFSYDLSELYTANDYDYDLLGAAARTKVDKTIPASQDLVFWHLFSQININVTFANDLAGTPIIGEVTGIRLENVVSKGTYQMSHNTNNTLTSPCSPSTATVDKKILNFTSSPALFHIIPQDVKTMSLYLNFRINEGTATSPVWVTYTDLPINLNVSGNANPYVSNGRYNWNISIGTGAAIKFNVSVTDWVPATEGNDGFDPDINM